MSELFFWNQWRKPYRNIYIILLILFFLANGVLIFSVINGNSFAFSWEVIHNYTSLKLPFQDIALFFIDVPLEAEHYIVEEIYQGSSLQIRPSVYAALAFFTLVFLSIIISIFTTLVRFWYLFGMTIVALVLAGLRLEQLMLFESTENIGLYIAIVLYLPLSYYFNSINKNIPLYYRIVSFLAISVIFGLVIFFFSAVENPFVYIGTYGILIPLLLSLIFIFLVSHDIISGFLNVVTSGNTSNSRNSLLHFSLISGLYLGWLLLTYLHNINYTNWDIIYINPAVLLFISGLVGIWGFRDRIGFVYPFIPFLPSGAILYLVLGILSFLTLGSFYVLANDPMLGMYEDFIIFSHLGVGGMFFLYIIGNFAGVLQKNLNVYKVLYKPKNLPYLVTSIGGIVIIGVLVARSILYPYYQGLSGYYNVLGDLYATEDQLFLGEQYYKLARSYDVTNQRSNYSLASLALKQGDEAVALKYFDDAVKRFPNEYAYVNQGNIYKEKGRFFDALFILNEGLQKFPENPYLQNNLGILYSQSSVVDSAIFYLERAGMSSEVKKTAEINKLATLIQHRLGTDVDSLKNNFSIEGELRLVNNQLIYLSQQEVPIKGADHKEINVSRRNIDAEAYTFWHEYTLNQLNTSTNNDLHSILFSMAADSSNANFQTELFFLSGISQYYENNVGEAFITLNNVRNISSSGTGYYSYLLGMWAMEQRSYRLAIDYFNKATNEGYKMPAYPIAVASTASRKLDEAAFYWDKVIHERDVPYQQVAYQMNQWLKGFPPQQSQGSIDSIAYIEVVFNETTYVPDLLGITASIKDESLLIDSWLAIFNKALEGGDYSGLNSLLDLLERKQLNDAQLKELNKLRWEFWLASNQLKKIKNQLDDSLIHKQLSKAPFLLHFHAKQARQAGEIEEATKYFNQLAILNPFYEEGVIDAAEFFNTELDEEEKAYKTLLDALNLNPYSASLNKAYIWQSLSMQLTNYAEKNLLNLQEVTSKVEYEKFLDLYNQKKDSLEQVQNQWN